MERLDYLCRFHFVDFHFFLAVSRPEVVSEKETAGLWIKEPAQRISKSKIGKKLWIKVFAITAGRTVQSLESGFAQLTYKPRLNPLPKLLIKAPFFA